MWLETSAGSVPYPPASRWKGGGTDWQLGWSDFGRWSPRPGRASALARYWGARRHVVTLNNHTNGRRVLVGPLLSGSGMCLTFTVTHGMKQKGGCSGSGPGLQGDWHFPCPRS